MWPGLIWEAASCACSADSVSLSLLIPAGTRPRPGKVYDCVYAPTICVLHPSAISAGQAVARAHKISTCDTYHKLQNSAVCSAAPAIAPARALRTPRPRATIVQHKTQPHKAEALPGCPLGEPARCSPGVRGTRFPGRRARPARSRWRMPPRSRWPAARVSAVPIIVEDSPSGTAGVLRRRSTDGCSGAEADD